MKRLFLLIFLGTMMNSHGQPLSQQVAQTAIHTWPDSFALPQDKFAKWRYDQGVILKGIEGIWNATGEGYWFNYIRKSMDFYVQDDGSIRGYKKDEFNIDHINNGKILLLLYKVTGKEKYLKAAHLLRNQLREHPRTSQGGFWHKKIYPYQMWLDGLYMGQPFYAEYAAMMGEDTAFNDITRQFVLMEKHARDTQTGLLYHGWDESRQQQWADKQTGLSPHFWSRALGWFGMAMVDVLDHFPKEHQGRDSIIQILNRFAKAVINVQDASTGLWYDVPDKKNEPKNYFEASGSAMLVYTLAKGIRKGYLPQDFIIAAEKGYNGIVKKFIKKDDKGNVNLHGTVSVSGLGGKPYRDGSFEYYMSEPVIVNDPKGMGAFILASVEMEMLPDLEVGKGLTILLDNFFNNEWKKGPAGTMIPFHYTWEDKSNSGFAMLGDIFSRHGFNTLTSKQAPSKNNLSAAQIYLIVDPDTEKETSNPNFFRSSHIRQIKKWVKNGGLLIMMGNNAGNAEFKHFNKLGKQFGIFFNEDNFNMVKNNHFEQGAVQVPENHIIFSSSPKLFIKELATLNINGKAKPVLEKDQQVIMAVSEYGQGTVFAIGDPWIYNEYIDGRKLPEEYQNYKAADEWVKWLAKQLSLSKTALN